MAIKTYLQAINDAMRQEMERDENVFIIGEDVGKFGGCFGVTQGLFDKFGERRVRDTPITESAIVGAAAGAAASCLQDDRPTDRPAPARPASAAVFRNLRRPGTRFWSSCLMSSLLIIALPYPWAESVHAAFCSGVPRRSRGKRSGCDTLPLRQSVAADNRRMSAEKN